MAKRTGKRNPKPQPKKPQKKQKAPVYMPPEQPPVTRPYKEAVRDWEIGADRELEEIAQQGNQVRDLYGESDARVQNIYRGLNNTWDQGIGQMEQNWGKAMRNMGNNFQQVDAANPFAAAMPEAQNSSVAPMLAQEQAAYAPVEAGEQQGFMNALTAMQANNANYDQSVGRQAAYEKGALRRNYLEDYNDQVEQLRQQRMNVFEDRGQQISQRAAELRDEQFNQQLALGQFGLNAQQMATQDKQAKFLRKYIQDLLEGGGRDGRPRNNNQSRNQGDYNNDGQQDETLTQPGGGWGWESTGRGNGKGKNKGGGTSPVVGINAPEGGGRRRGRSPAKRYDNLTEKLEWAHKNFPNAYYDERQDRWENGYPDGSRSNSPIPEINRPRRRRARIVKKNPRLQGRAGNG